MIRVVFALEQRMVRAGLAALLAGEDDIDVADEAGNGREVFEVVERSGPDVLVLGLVLPGLNGLDVLARLRRDDTRVRTLVLTRETDVEWVAGAFREGASGYLVTSSPPDELAGAVRAVADGRRYLCPEVAGAFVDDYLTGRSHPKGPFEVLTPRQREVLQLVAEGHSSREIAEKLFISVKTVETHRADLMDRLDIHDVAGLTRYAIRNRLASPED